LTMTLTAAERNRRKRQRKKKEKKEHEEDSADAEALGGKSITNAPEVEIEYVTEPVTINESDGTSESLQEMKSVLRKFEERAVVVTDDDTKEATETTAKDDDNNEDDDDDEENISRISKRKLREIIRPSLADLKRRVKRPDLVEAHDVTAFDPEFLVEVRYCQEEFRMGSAEASMAQIFARTPLSLFV
jgi:splicing factor 3B subunit 2